MDYQILIEKYNRGIKVTLFSLYSIVLIGFVADLIEFSIHYPIHLLIIQITCTILIASGLIIYIIKRKAEVFHFNMITYLNVFPIIATHLLGQEYIRQIADSSSEMFSRDYFIIICFISFSGFVSNRKNIFVLSGILGFLVLYYIIILHNQFVLVNAPLYFLIMIGFSFLMYFLSSYINNFINSLRYLNEELKILNQAAEKKNKKLEKYNSLQIEIARGFGNLQNSMVDLKQVYQSVCRTAVNELECDNVSIWMFNTGKEKLMLLFQFENGKEATDIYEISRSDFPLYFTALDNKLFIFAIDAKQNEDTHELIMFSDRNKDTYSMLDCAITIDGKTIGAICCKKYYKAAGWENEEVLFIESLAATVAMNIKNLELKSANQELENTLTLLNNTQNQLIGADKMASLGLIAAEVAHEINNPLNFILGGYTRLELYYKENPQIPVDDVVPSLNAIKVGVERVTEIVQSLGYYSRTGESQTEICDINEILNHCLIILNNQIKYKIEVQKDYTKDSCILKGNNGKLHQVFTNLLTNSIHAITDKGTIALKTRIENNLLIVSVKDSGSGISKENLDKIMKPFFTTKEPGKGTGLGLSIVQGIIQEHSGTIEYFSEIGKGTEVIVTLPLSV